MAFDIPNIGFEDSDFEVDSLSNVQRVLLDFGNEMQTDLRSSLRRGGKYGSSMDSGELAQSIDFNTTENETGFKFQLTLADYYDYVDKGVKGAKSSIKAPASPYKFGAKQPPIRELELWARKKSINVFALAKSIREKGINGNHFYDRVVTKQRLKQLSSDLQDASAKDIKVKVRRDITGIFGSTIKIR